jgi:hypothetical protein
VRLISEENSDGNPKRRYKADYAKKKKRLCKQLSGPYKITGE